MSEYNKEKVWSDHTTMIVKLEVGIGQNNCGELLNLFSRVTTLINEGMEDYLL